MSDTRLTRAIDLLRSADSLSSPLVDDAIALMEELCDELPRPVWCPHDVRRTATDAAQYPSELGVPA